MPRRIYFMDDGEPMTPEYWQPADAAPAVPSRLSLSGLAGDNVEPALHAMYVAFRPLWGGTADLRRLQRLVTATDLHLPTAVITRSIRDIPLERPNYLVNWREGEYWYWRHYTQRLLSCMGAASLLRTRHLLVHRDCMGGDFTCSPLFPQATQGELPLLHYTRFRGDSYDITEYTGHHAVAGGDARDSHATVLRITLSNFHLRAPRRAVRVGPTNHSSFDVRYKDLEQTDWQGNVGPMTRIDADELILVDDKECRAMFSTAVGVSYVTCGLLTGMQQHCSYDERHSQCYFPYGVPRDYHADHPDVEGPLYAGCSPDRRITTIDGDRLHCRQYIDGIDILFCSADGKTVRHIHRMKDVPVLLAPDEPTHLVLGADFLNHHAWSYNPSADLTGHPNRVLGRLEQGALLLTPPESFLGRSSWSPWARPLPSTSRPTTLRCSPLPLKPTRLAWDGSSASPACLLSGAPRPCCTT